MPLAFLIDENSRGLLWRHIQRHNAKRIFPIDAICVGNTGGPPLGIDDPHLLLWAEEQNRILVSRDNSTLAAHLAAHVATGNHSPGIFPMRLVPLREIMEFLVCAAHPSEPAEWENQIKFIP